MYRGAAMPSFAGKYFYGDYCTGRLFANDVLLTPRPTSLTTFGQDAAGELYLGTGGGGFFRVAEVGAPTVTPTPTRSDRPTADADRSLRPARARYPRGDPRPDRGQAARGRPRE